MGLFVWFFFFSCAAVQLELKFQVNDFQIVADVHMNFFFFLVINNSEVIISLFICMFKCWVLDFNI